MRNPTTVRGSSILGKRPLILASEGGPPRNNDEVADDRFPHYARCRPPARCCVLKRLRTLPHTRSKRRLICLTFIFSPIAKCIALCLAGAGRVLLRMERTFRRPFCEELDERVFLSASPCRPRRLSGCIYLFILPQVSSSANPRNLIGEEVHMEPVSTEDLQSEITHLRDRVDLIAEEQAAKKPWFKDVSTIIAVAAFLFSFGTTIILQTG